MKKNTPIITIISKSGGGKTTLMEKLIRELDQRGYRVGTIKHHSHSGFEIDQPGKDSWRHAQAGSRHVVIAAPDKVASYRLLEQELSLQEVAREMQDVDIILTEGYRNAGMPTIEVLRLETGLPRISDPRTLIALVTDTALPDEIPQFGLEQIGPLADLVEKLFLQKQP